MASLLPVLPPIPEPINKKKLLNEMLNSELSAEELFPDRGGENLEEFWLRVEVLCEGFGHLRKVYNRIKPLIGRALLVVSGRPSLFKARGYRHFNEFLFWTADTYGISRSECYDCMRIARAFPQLTPAQFGEIGVSKLKIAAKLTDESGTTVDRVAILETARTMPYKQFTEHVEKKYHIGKDDHKYVLIGIHTTEKIKTMWATFASDPRIQAYCKTETEGGILACLMEECAVEWLANAEQSLDPDSGVKQ